MPATLISATPSPYARKVRIALHEKDIPFTLQTEIPWHNDTETPKYNPLERLPILIFEEGTAVYESHFIMEYLETKFPEKVPLLSKDIDEMLLAKQIEVVVDGVCDATRDLFFEEARGPEKLSQEWKARQVRKIHAGVKAVARWVKAAEGKEYIVGNQFSLADVAVGTLLGFMDMAEQQKLPAAASFPDWKVEHPELLAYYEKMDERPSFRETRPVMFELKDKVV